MKFRTGVAQDVFDICCCNSVDVDNGRTVVALAPNDGMALCSVSLLASSTGRGTKLIMRLEQRVRGSAWGNRRAEDVVCRILRETENLEQVPNNSKSR